MWTPEPNGSAIALNSPPPRLTHCMHSVAQREIAKLKKKGQGERGASCVHLNIFTDYHGFLLMANTNNRECCKKFQAP